MTKARQEARIAVAGTAGEMTAAIIAPAAFVLTNVRAEMDTRGHFGLAPPLAVGGDAQAADRQDDEIAAGFDNLPI